jgi:hypothetical protein
VYEVDPQEQVQYSLRGRRFHKGAPYGPCGMFLATGPTQVEKTTAEVATARGKTPCRDCFGS